MIIRPDEEELTVKTGGKILGGWTDFRVFRSVERLPSGFAIGLTERYPGIADTAIVEPFSPCEIYLSGDKILTGYVDRYSPNMNASDHQAGITGRSKTEDLVDCSIDIKQTGWAIAVASLQAAAKKVCDPYGIDVIMPDGDVALDLSHPFSVIPGMTCWQLLEELAAAAERLIWDDAEGRLVLSAVGTKRAATPLVEGVNAEIAAAMFAADQRYSDVWVVGQTQIAGTPGHISYFGEKKDAAVPRKRMLMIVMDIPGPDEKWSKQRAAWEVSRRYGRSRQVQVTVTGWRDGAGQLWTPNTITRVKAPTLKIDEDWLICDCEWRRSEAGTQTLMRLMPKDGLMPAPFHPLQPIPLSGADAQRFAGG